MKKSSLYIVLILIINSCMTEKINTTPLSSSFSNIPASTKSSETITLENILETNQNAAEITEDLVTFPIFKDEKLNREVNTLKIETQNYLYAIEANNSAGKMRSLKNIETAYKKIQKIRENLNSSDNELINGYMVRLKTNVSQLESVTNSSNPK